MSGSVGRVLFPLPARVLNKNMREYRSSVVLMALLLLLGAMPMVLLAASAWRPDPVTASRALGQERISLRAPHAQPVALTVEIVDMAAQPEKARRLRGMVLENGGLMWLHPQVTDQPLEAHAYTAPVSVAFFDRNGVILQVLDLKPCSARCPSYFPKVAYRGRLEVAWGWFAQQGIGVGSQIEGPSIQVLKARSD
ncbi:hypothetical protein Mhypo_03303 [Meiothermus hypogaeus]|nr:hypothetical protein Mhypo_03303 [Meiothermus hypogaeus]